MIRLIPLIFLALSCGAYASEKLGLKDISVASLDGKLTLQLDHLFLGAGDRQANITFYGCSEGVKKYQIQNKFYSEFELRECTLNSTENIYIELSYGQPDSENIFSRYKITDETRIKSNRVTQVENYLSAKLRFIEEKRDGVLILHIVDKHGSCSTKIVSFSLIAGNTLYYNKWLKEGDFIKEFIVNDTKLMIEHE